MNLSTFKKYRKHEGTCAALMICLIKSGVKATDARDAVCGLIDTYNIRALEKMKSKDLYEYIEGFVEGYKNTKSLIKEFIIK